MPIKNLDYGIAADNGRYTVFQIEDQNKTMWFRLDTRTGQTWSFAGEPDYAWVEITEENE